MTDWSTPLNEDQIDWSSPLEEIHTSKKNKSPFPLQGFGLGLAQALENQAKQLVSYGAEHETQMPEMFQHPRVRNKPETNRSPSFNFEQYVDPSQQFQFKVGEYAPEIAGGALAGAAILKGLGRQLGKIGSKSIGKNIVKDVKNLKSDFRKEYEGIFNEAEKGGVKPYASKTSRQELEQVFSNVDKKYYSGLEKFLEKPTTRNAHLAQSDLGKLIRKLSSKKELVTAEHDALKAARNAQDILKQEVYSNLMKEGGLELPFKYADVTKKYSQQMVPYLENTAVRRASLNPGQKGYISPERLPQKLKLESSDPLMAHLREMKEGTKVPLNPALHGKYPLLKANQMLTSPFMRYLLAGTGLGTGGYGSFELLKALMKGS